MTTGLMISDLKAREILDSRGNPTVEVDMEIEKQWFGRAAVPSGASTGAHEAAEKRDGDKRRFGGKGVLGAVQSVNSEIAQVITSLPFNTLRELDQKLITMDDSRNKSRLGANALLGVSMAYAKAVAQMRGLPLYQSLGGERAVRLPMPLVNIVNGGAHANNGLSIQEFMIVPVGAPRFSEAIRSCAEVFHALKAELKDQGQSTAVGDEGGFAPMMKGGTRGALDIIMTAIDRAGYKPGVDMALALDVAATELYQEGRYKIDDEVFQSDELIDFYASLAATYPIVSIEDGMSEDDWAGWTSLTESMGDKLQLVGDDLFVTNPVRLQQGLRENAANAILIKPNQIGTLTETLTTIELAQREGMNVVLSHRSGETEDTTIADLAVATNAGQIKTGSICRTDRLAKYNQLLRIEEELGTRGTFFAPKYGNKGA